MNPGVTENDRNDGLKTYVPVFLRYISDLEKSLRFSMIGALSVLLSLFLPFYSLKRGRAVADLPVGLSMPGSIVTAVVVILLIASIIRTERKKYFFLSGIVVASVLFWIPVSNMFDTNRLYRTDIGLYLYWIGILLVLAGAVLAYRKDHT